MADLSAIEAAVAPVAASLGLELYDVELSGTGRARILRVLVDREGGIDLDAVAAATEAISPVLDEEPAAGALAGPYSLEISSPGLERPLRTAAHFRRAVGETVSVKTRSGEEPARRARGVVQRAGDDTFELLLDDGTHEVVAYADVVQARTVFEWGPQPKGPKRATKAAKPVASQRAANESDANEREVVRP